MSYRNLNCQNSYGQNTLLVAVFFITNNEWKLWNNIFERFSPQLSWCKEALFIAPNRAPSWGLLYHSSSIINVHFQRIMPDIMNFCLFKELYFPMRFITDVLQLQQSQFRKKNLTSNLSPYLQPQGITTAKQLYNIFQ